MAFGGQHERQCLFPGIAGCFRSAGILSFLGRSYRFDTPIAAKHGLGDIGDIGKNAVVACEAEAGPEE